MKKGKKVYIITASVLTFLFVAANITSLVFIPKVFDNLFGGETGSGRGDTKYYRLDDGITTKEEAKANTDKVNEEICEEGFVLLKNNNVLPVAANKDAKPKVSVFGKNSANLMYGGSGSGGGDRSSAKTIYQSLEEANFDVNPTLKAFYASSDSGSGRPDNLAIEAGIPTGFAIGETPVSSYSQTVKDSFSQYNNLAVVVISRTGGEGNDLPKTMKSKSNPVSGAYSADDHYLELDKNEQEMLKMVCDNFNKVVLVVNSNQVMELGFLDAINDGDDTVIDYDFSSKIGAAIWVGGPGNSGIMALGRILNGEVNPSGRTVDIFPRDFTKMPSYVNFSVGNHPDTYLLNNVEQTAWFSDYEEGIYNGYKYYETRSDVEGGSWYQNNVVYPFGYGLSYTTFNQSIKNKSSLSGKEIKKDSEFEVIVHVDNNSNVSGKDVVQLYVETPYTNGQIEKASRVLLAYGKSKIITKGDSGADVKLNFSSYDFASYDYSDANSNGFKGYELDKGTYKFHLCKNSHEIIDTFQMEVKNYIQFDKDPITGNKVENLYDDADDELGSILSRSNFNGTFPQIRTDEERKLSSTTKQAIDKCVTNNPLTAESEEVVNSDLIYAKKKDPSVMQLWELIGEPYDSPKWDTFLEGITISSMTAMLNYAAFGTDSIDYIGKPKTIESDGPSGYVVFMGDSSIFGVSSFASEPIIAATYNNELVEKLGKAVGNEGILGNTNDGTGYSGLYAPGMNLHRSPFGGRAAEYYSEDSLLTGTMASSFIVGMHSKGVNTYMKHFAVNESETHRNGVCTWVDEQTLREVYLKPFEIAVKRSEGSAMGVMSSFNRIGAVWTGGDYRLITTNLRDEWGFQGAVICDFADLSYMDNKTMMYAGGDLYLNNISIKSWVDKNNNLDIYVLKNATKNHLYTVVNSNAMNGLGEGIVYHSNIAKWKIVLFIIDGVVAAGLIAWSVIIFFPRKEQEISIIEK